MAGGISALLNTSRSSLTAQSAAIRTIGNNLANVNTPGYSRRQVELVTADTADVGESNFGLGVNINRVTRTVDKFVSSQYEQRLSDSGRASIRNEILGRAEPGFSIDGSLDTIGTSLSAFFSSLNDLANNPADIPLRSNVMQAGQNLSRTISETYKQIASLQREADTRLETLVTDVNDITQKLASLNIQIRGSEPGNQENLALRDQRDELLRQLAGKLSYQKTEFSDGSIGVSLANGFGLVSQTGSKDLEYTQNPSFAPGPPGFPRALDGGALGFIVYDFDPTAGTSHVDLTDTIAGGSGDAAGLLTLRGVQATTDASSFDAVGDLVSIAARVEVIAEDLLTRFNRAYMGPFDENPATVYPPGPYDPSSGDLNGNSPTKFGLFTFQGVIDNGDGVAVLGDLTASMAALGLGNVASLLEFGPKTEEEIAAAVDQDAATAGSTVFPQGDATNLARITALQTQQVNFAVYANGAVPLTTTIENLYHQTVTFVGSMKSKADSDQRVAKDQETQTKELYSSISGVSTDEELAKLISFQRTYQASARMIGTGDQLLGELISLLGR